MLKLDASGKVVHAAAGIPAARLWPLLHQALTLGAAASASSIDGDVVSHGKPTGKAPDGGPSLELRALERRWANAKSPSSQREILRDAIALYKQQTLPNPDPSLKPGTKEWRERVAHDPRSSRDVAEMYGVSHTSVCAWRQEFLGRRRAEAVK